LKAPLGTKFATQELKTRHMSFVAVLFCHILQLICFKILFTESKYFNLTEVMLI